MPTEESLKNLKSFRERSPEERKRIASNGGKAAAKKREENKTFKTTMEWVMKQPALKGNVTVQSLRKKFPGLTNMEAIAIAMTAEAIQNQNVKAFTAIRDTIGEVPVKSVSVDSNEPIKISIETVD